MRILKENETFILERPIILNWKYCIKRFIIPILSLFFHLVLKLKRSRRKSRKYNIVICGIFKNESRFLKEWIEYHRIIGIDHFFLYNNFSNDSYLDVLNIYIKQNIVTLIDWPVNQGQISAYKHFYENFSEQSQWFSFLDIDEFICLRKNDKNIAEWIFNYIEYPCIVMYWKMFGTSGRLNHNFDLLVTEQYSVCWDKLYSIGKTFFNTDFQIEKFHTSVHHMARTRIRFLVFEITIAPINEFKKFIIFDIHRVRKKISNDFRVQINHYWSKAFDEYIYKTKKGDVAFADNPKDIGYFYAHEQYNRTTDFSIYRFLIQLKTAMGLYKTKS